MSALPPRGGLARSLAPRYLPPHIYMVAPLLAPPEGGGKGHGLGGLGGLIRGQPGGGVKMAKAISGGVARSHAIPPQII
jgi:hypothetical protein